MEYATAWKLQQDMVATFGNGRHADRLLLLEHPPVYTLGRSGNLEHLLVSRSQLQREGVELQWVDRGGDITFHGPGQLVGYPILDLRALFARRGEESLDLHRYLRDVEEVIIKTLAALGVQGWRFPDYTGVWVGDEADPRKIAAIGIKVSSRGISSHGFAVNVAPDLDYFSRIVPCGIHDFGVTSLADVLGVSLKVTDIIPLMVTAVEEVFDAVAQVVSPEMATPRPATNE
jgi:lipoate-protein ligase B